MTETGPQREHRVGMAHSLSRLRRARPSQRTDVEPVPVVHRVVALVGGDDVSAQRLGQGGHLLARAAPHDPAAGDDHRRLR